MKTVEVYFWHFVDMSGDCWMWTGCRNYQGYGYFRFEGKMRRAHRIAWILTNGPIPHGEGFHGICVLHRCDNRLCVKPDHLFLGTNHDNVIDMWKKGRGNPWVGIAVNAALMKSRTHCKRGHPYAGSNLYLTSHGRGCKACLRLKQYEYVDRHAA